MELNVNLVAAIKTIRGALEDLAQPLAIVTGTVGLLQLELTKESEYVDSLHNIGEQLEHIVQIIDGIWRLVDKSAGSSRAVEIEEKKRFAERYPQEPQTPQPMGEPPIVREDNEILRDLATAFKNIRRAIHDLAQPMVVVTGTIDLMLLELDRKSGYYAALQTTSEQLEHIVQSIDKVRQVARQVSDALQEL